MIRDRLTCHTDNLNDARASRTASRRTANLSPHGLLNNRSSACAAPPQGGVGQVLFCGLLAGVSGAALVRRSFCFGRRPMGSDAPLRSFCPLLALESES